MRLLVRGVAAALLLLACAAAAGGQQFSPSKSPAGPGGVRATVDLPAAKHLRNTGGSDGLGLCVFTSIYHAALWQNVTVLEGYRRWMERRPGGGYPSKVDQTLAAYCRELGVPVPPYVQHTGGDEEFLDLAIRTDRCAALTYDGRDDFYGGRVAHMVNLVYLDSRYGAILDNNRPGVWLWMSRADLLSRWRGSGGGWAVVLLAPPPPPHLPGNQPADSRHEWVGSAASPAGLCDCRAGGACACGPACRCEAGMVFGQCANGRCGVPTPAAPSESPQPDGWTRHEYQDGTAWKLHQGGRFVGLYDSRGFHPGSDDSWTTATAPLPAGVAAPDAPAGRVVTATGESVPTGVIPSLIHDAPGYSHTGRPCTKDEALRAVGAGGLADDSDHYHLTAVGDATLTAKLRADVAALPEAVRGKLLVQCYAPDAWPVSLFKLPAGVSLRGPSPAREASQIGAVGTAEYLAGTTALADLLSLPGGPGPAAPKKPDPPAPGPAPTPAPVPSPEPSPSSPPWVVILLGIAAWLFRRR